MPGFLYFLPNQRASKVDGDLLASFGLSHICDRKDQQTHARDVVANGPGGLAGAVVGVADKWEAEEVKQSPELHWKAFPKSHAANQAWLGWKELPKPAEIARGHQLPGEWLTLADGEKWLVPVAKKASPSGLVCALPCTFDLDEETGRWLPNRVRRDYASLWEHAVACHLAIMSAATNDSQSYEIPNAELLVPEVLSANYRVSARELATLGVLDSNIIGQVVRVLLDYSGMEALKKKPETDTGSGLDGLAQ